MNLSCSSSRCSTDRIDDTPVMSYVHTHAHTHVHIYPYKGIEIHVFTLERVLDVPRDRGRAHPYYVGSIRLDTYLVWREHTRAHARDTHVHERARAGVRRFAGRRVYRLGRAWINE